MSETTETVETEISSGPDTGSINITIGENGLNYDTSFNLMETIFWLEALKSEILRSVFTPDAA